MSEDQFDEAITLWDALGDFDDSPKQRLKCQNAIDESAYQDGMALMADQNYRAAVALCDAINGYGDSAKHAAMCRTILVEQEYATAQQLMG